MINKGYSVTSNEVKLFKHLPNLHMIQDNYMAPVMFHISLTNKCNQSCVHCCFADRDKKQEIPLEKALRAIDQMAMVGTKTIELTGGGEPTQYSDIRKFLQYAFDCHYTIGMNTNALDISTIPAELWGKFKWVRVALNVFDLDNPELIEKFTKNIETLQKLTKITGCYIVPQQIGTKNLFKVIDFAKKYGIVTRIAPDCIQDKPHINSLIEDIKSVIPNPPEGIFISDFNIFLGERKDNMCYMHMLKPFLFTDGWIYACPSSELAVENGKTMNEKFRICKMEDIVEYYKNNFELKKFECSYCKYTNQNNIIDSLLVETDDNEFC